MNYEHMLTARVMERNVFLGSPSLAKIWQLKMNFTLT